MKRLLLILILACYMLPSIATASITDFKKIKEAKKAYEMKAYDKSTALLKDVQQGNESSELHYNLGNTYYKKGHYDKAIEEYKLAKDVDKASRLYNIGNSYVKKGEFDKAIKSYKESLKYRDDPDVKNNLKVAKKKKKQEQKKKEQKKKDDKKKDDKKNDKDKKQDKKSDKDKKQQDKKKNDKNNKDKKKQDKDKKKQDKKKEQDKKKKDGDKKKSDSKKEKKPKDEKGSKASNESKEQKKMSKEKKLKEQEQELRRLLKKMGQKNAPTMMYQMDGAKKHKPQESVNPW